MENPEHDEGDVVPARDHRREQRADRGEAEAGAVHHLDAEVLGQPTADYLNIVRSEGAFIIYFGLNGGFKSISTRWLLHIGD